MAKGGSFEREICDRLSLWWCGDPDRRVFWRSSGSGATASVRAKKGKRTADHHGDVCCIDPCGAALTDLLTIECKRGHNRVSLQDLLDCRPGQKGGNGKGENLPDWIARAQTDHEAAGSYSWLLIVRRDGRLPLAIMPEYLATGLAAALLDVGLRFDRLCAVPLDKFLTLVLPADVRRLAKEV